MALLPRILHPATWFVVMTITFIVIFATGGLSRDIAALFLILHVFLSVGSAVLTKAWPTRLGISFIGQTLLAGLCHWLLPEPLPGTGPVLLLATGSFVPAAIAAASLRWAIIRHLPSSDPDAPPPPVSDGTARIVVTCAAILCLLGAGGLGNQALHIAELSRPVEAQVVAIPHHNEGTTLPDDVLSQILISARPLEGTAIVNVEITNTSDYVLTDLEIEAKALDRLGVSRGRAYFRLSTPLLPLGPDARRSVQLEMPTSLDPVPAGTVLNLGLSYGSGSD